MELVILIGLLVVNGVFAMSELAMVSARKARLQPLADEGDLDAQATLQLLEAPDRFLSTVQIGITLIGVIAGVFGGSTLAEDFAVTIEQQIPALAPYADAVAAGSVVLLTTYLSLVIGELVPKRLAIQNPEPIAMTVARPMQRLSRVTAPLVSFLSGSTNLIVWLLGAKPSDEPSVTQTEVLSMIEQGIEGGVFAAAEQKMVQGVFDLDDTMVREIVTPRTDIIWLDIEDSHAAIRQKITDNVFSAYPVCREDIDNVVGVIHSRDLLLHLLQSETIHLESVMKTPLFIPETVAVSKVLRRFQDTGMHIALIVGEHGGVEGLVTLTDIIEEIFGDVDRADPQITRRDDGSYLLDGYMPIAHFEDLFPHIPLPEAEHGEYHSVAGFVLLRLGRIPEAGDSFVWHEHRFEVMDMDGVRVDKILLRKVETP
jgi:putative hemolysin